LVKVKRINDAFLYRILEIPLQAPNKNSAAARGNDTTIGVYDILPSSCMRRAYYRKKLEREVAQPKEPVMPYLIRGRAVEAAIARMFFGNATTMDRHKRYEKRRIACYADLSDSKRIIEIKDKNTDRRLFPEDIQFKRYLMQVLYYMVIAEREEALLLINYSSKELVWHHNDSDGRSCSIGRQMQRALASSAGTYLCQRMIMRRSCSGIRCCGARMHF
jgi:hypothetical protein